MALDYSFLGLNQRLRKTTSLSPDARYFNDSYSFDANSDVNLMNNLSLMRIGTAIIDYGDIGTAKIDDLTFATGTADTLGLGTITAEVGTINSLTVSSLVGGAVGEYKQYALLVGGL